MVNYKLSQVHNLLFLFVVLRFWRQVLKRSLEGNSCSDLTAVSFAGNLGNGSPADVGVAFLCAKLEHRVNGWLRKSARADMLSVRCKPLQKKQSWRLAAR